MLQEGSRKGGAHQGLIDHVEVLVEDHVGMHVVVIAAIGMRFRYSDHPAMRQVNLVSYSG
jgi:hypothetical protein